MRGLGGGEIGSQVEKDGDSWDRNNPIAKGGKRGDRGLISERRCGPAGGLGSKGVWVHKGEKLVSTKKGFLGSNGIERPKKMS